MANHSWSVRASTIRSNREMSFQSPSSPPSTPHGPSRSMPRSVLSQTTADHIHPAVSRSRRRGRTISRACWRVLHKHGLKTANLEFHVRQCVHKDRCETRRHVSCSVHALCNRPHQPDLALSGGKFANTRRPDDERKWALLTSMNMSLHDLACLLSVIITLIWSRTASRGVVPLRPSVVL